MDMLSIQDESNKENDDSCFIIPTGAHFEKYKMYGNFIPYQIETELFKINSGVLVKFYKNTPCLTFADKPILGNNFVGSSTLILDFENNKISLYNDSVAISKISKEGYSLVKSSPYKRSKIFNLHLSVDSVESPFLFDTGAPITIMSSEHYKTKDGDQIIEGSIAHDIGGTAPEGDNYISDREFKISDNLSLTNNVTYINNLENNVLGMNFISRFNWIIDYKNNEVYCKPIKETQEKHKYFYYRAFTEDGKLIVIAKNKNETAFELNSVIKSVDGVQITPENICDYINLLNSAENWNNFKIEIEKK